MPCGGIVQCWGGVCGPVMRTLSSVWEAALARRPAIFPASFACRGMTMSSVETPVIAGTMPTSRAMRVNTTAVSIGPAQANTQNGPRSSKRRTSLETRLTICPVDKWLSVAPLSCSTLSWMAAMACRLLLTLFKSLVHRECDEEAECGT